jgi:hypothetical protein
VGCQDQEAPKCESKGIDFEFWEQKQPTVSNSANNPYSVIISGLYIQKKDLNCSLL